MRFLQTGDWHLGKVFFGASLIEDQKFFLAQVAEELTAAQNCGEPYDALIVPGDIYDRAVPPADAVSALGAFLSQAHRDFPALKLFFLAGNHDSPERLAFAQDVLGESNIHICTDCKNIAEPVIVNGVAVYQLPYLTAGCLARKDADEGEFSEPLRTQQELLDAAVQRIASTHKKNYGGMDAVLCAHLFTAGALRSDSERIAVGNAEQADAASLSFFTYAALGHLHKFQKAAENAYYSGSPLAYSFDESTIEKCMLRVTLQDGSFTVEKRPVKPLRRCTVITDQFDAIYNSNAYDAFADDYIQVICTDRSAIANPMNILRSKFANALSFAYESQHFSAQESAQSAERRQLLSTAEVAPEALVTAFLKSVYGEAAVSEDETFQEEIKLFAQFAKEIGGAQ